MNSFIRAATPKLRISAVITSLVTVTLVAAASVTYANQTEPEPVIESLPDLMVSATRSTSLPGLIAASKIIIDREQIELSGASNVAEVLSSVAGVQLQDLFGNGASVTVGMRGFGGNAAMNSLIMIDGRRLNNSFDIGPARLTGISVDQIEAIEIISGSAGVLFGEGAVGGVINIITRNSTDGATIDVGLGSHSNQRLRVSFAKRAGDWDLSVGAEKHEADNYRDYNDIEISTVDLEVGRTIDLGRVWFELSSSDEFQQLPGALITTAYAADRNASSNSTDYLDGEYRAYRAGASITLNKQWHLEVDLTKRFDDITAVQGGSSPFSQERNQSSINPRVIGQFGQSTGNLTVTAGLDYDDAGYVLGSSFGVDQGNQNVSSAYLQVLVPVTSDLKLHTGIRNSKFDSEIVSAFNYPTGASNEDSFSLLSLGVDWMLTDSVRVFLRRAENARAAKLDEHTTSTVLLDHQFGVSLETGLHISLSQTVVDISYYEIDLTNEIFFDAASYVNVNLDTSKRVGADLAILSQLSPAISVNFQLSLVDATFDSGTYVDKQIPFVARQNISAGLSYRLADAGSLHFEWLETGKRFAASDFDNSNEKLKSQNQINVTWRRKIQRFTVETRINNLMDRDNVAFATETSGGDIGFYAAPTRNFLVTVSYQPE